MNHKELQIRLGVTPDGIFGPQSQRAFIDSFVNKNAPAITGHDYYTAAQSLNVPVNNLKALAKKESGGSSFSLAGRPKILFEAHWFSRLTNRRYDRSHPHISSRRWNRRLYARHMPGRYRRLAQAVALDVDAGLSSASWGKFQIMGFHWKNLGYASPWAFAQSMVVSEKNHLDALIAFLQANRLVGALAQCRPYNADSCRALAYGYNGPGYESHNYHGRLANLIGSYAQRDYS